jgi:hypothetical protein
MSNTWGALSWGQGDWAGQGDVSQTLSGISASFSVGQVVADAEIQIGWGGDTWGENEWGDLSGSQPIAVGSQLTSSIGSVSELIIADATVDVTNLGQMAFGEQSVLGGTSVNQNVTGQELTSSMGEEVIGIGVPVSGITASFSAGAATVDGSTLTGIGWSRGSWGEFAWGVAYSALAEGQQLTSSINFPATGAFTDVNVSVSGVELTSTFASPSFSIVIDQDIFVLATEDQLDATAGSVEEVTGTATVDVTGISLSSSIGDAIAGLFLDVPVTGSQITSTLGDFSLQQSTIEPVTGQQLTSSLGQAEEVPDQIIGVSGIQLSSSVGQITATGNALVQPTGIQLTSSTGSPNITAWQEINLGVNNIWTEVDLAA